jgi:hypothetical protein
MCSIAYSTPWGFASAANIEFFLKKGVRGWGLIGEDEGVKRLIYRFLTYREAKICLQGDQLSLKCMYQSFRNQNWEPGGSTWVAWMG